MNTKIVTINPKRISSEKILYVASLLKKGEVVALPTETVYGLGANALNPKAVKKIFKAKGRPTDNPLIVHIYNMKQLKLIAKDISDDAKKLMRKFWPGPLTLILPKTKKVPDIITAGRETVGVRMPHHRIALALIRNADLPIAAPSANSFGKPSPTISKHVIEDLSGKIAAIIDGGSVKIGIESTIIDMTSKTPVLLRPGGITLEEIQKIIGKISVHESVNHPQKKMKDALAPGMKYKHYSPKAKVILLEKTSLKKALEMYPSAIAISLNKTIKEKKNVKYIKNLNHLAKEIFFYFREADEKNIPIIIVDKIPEKGIGMSILNRVKKAATKII